MVVRRRPVTRALVLVWLVVGGGLIAGAGSAAATGEALVAPGDTLVVDGERDGDGEYAKIGLAMEAATDGDRIEVRPGTYGEQVVIDKNVTLIAPNGATLNGSQVTHPFPEAFKTPRGDVGAAGPGSPVAFVLDGFTIKHYDSGVGVRNTTGAWTIRNTTIINSSLTGVFADYSTGDWTVENVRFVDGFEAVSAVASTGDWTIRDTVSVDDGNIVDATESTGDWTVHNVTVNHPAANGVMARRATGAWTVRDATIRNATVGIDAVRTTGAWTIRNATVTAREVAIQATSARGDWTIQNVSLAASDPNDTILPNTPPLNAAFATGAFVIEDSTISGGVDLRRTDGNWTLDDTRVSGGYVDAGASTGAWTIRDVAITNVSARDINNGVSGVYARYTTGNWTIRTTVIRHTPGPGIRAGRSTGSWAIHTSSIVDTGSAVETLDGTGIATEGKTATGNATRNWWGSPDGPTPPDRFGDGADCGINVTCANYLTTPPNAGPNLTDDSPDEHLDDGQDGEDGEDDGGPRPVVGDAAPVDPDGDGLFEDVNGDGEVTPGDATVLFNAVFEGTDAVTNNPEQFDVNGDGSVTPGDATVLFNEVFES